MSNPGSPRAPIANPMKVLLTGSSGRIGRAIFGTMISQHEVVGLDKTPFATTSLVGDVANPELLKRALEGVDAIIHTASLHAPHVGLESDFEFHRVNLGGLQTLVTLAKQVGVSRLVYTSTTALYGNAVIPGQCSWIDEQTTPLPRTIYHRTKLDAEELLASEANAQLSISAIRMSRCFPEPVDQMALFRLHRGIDVRDVADAHVAALNATGRPFERFIASGATPFQPEDTATLAHDVRQVLALRCPKLLSVFDEQQWPLPASVDRVYAPTHAETHLGWKAQYGYTEVLAQHDARSCEVLPRSKHFRDRTQE